MGRLVNDLLKLLGIAAGVACAIPSTLIAGTIRHDKTDSQYTSLAANSAYASVGKVSTNLGNASGVLLDSRWVLTAGHVVAYPNPNWVGFSINGTDYGGSDWVAHPDWLNSLGFGADLALVRLNAPVAGVTAATRYTGSAEVGATGTIVGFGLSGTGLTGEQAGTYGTKRAGNNVIDALGTAAGNSDNYLMADFDRPVTAGYNSFGSATPLALEYSSAQGDSGGGLFITDGGVQKLAGIVSFGQQGPIGNATLTSGFASYGDLMGFTRVSAFNSWIDEHLTSRYWSNSLGGTFSSGGNWDEGSAATAGNITVLNLENAYTISFASDAASKQLRLSKGYVSLDLQGHMYSLGGTPLGRSLAIERKGSISMILMVHNGTLAATDVAIGESEGTNGELRVETPGAYLKTSGSVYLGKVGSASGGAGDLRLGSGSIGGGLMISSRSTATLGGQVVTRDLILDGGTLAIGGSFSITGTGTYSRGTYKGYGTTTIGPAAAFHFQPLAAGSLTISSHTFANSGSLVFHDGVIPYTDALAQNLGTVTKLGAGSAQVGMLLNNAGTLRVDQGSLSLNNSGTHDGVFVINPGATLAFGAGLHTINNIAGLPSSRVALTGGTLSFNGNHTFNELLWSSGALRGPGTTTFVAGGTFTIDSWGSRVVDSRVLDNAGTIRWLEQGNLHLAGSGIVNNLAGALFEIQGIGSILATNPTPAAAFNNLGTLRKTTGDGSFTIQSKLHNAGLVDVQRGTLRLAGGGTHSGTFQVGPSGTLAFAGGLHTITDPSRLAASGVELQEGELVLQGNASFSRFSLNGGSLSSTGITTILPGGTMTIDTYFQKAVNSMTLNNQGYILWRDNGYLLNMGTAVLNNQAGATFETQAFAWMTGAPSVGGNATFNNSGTFRSTAGASDIWWYLSNSGTVNVEQSKLTLKRGGTHTGTFIVGNGGSLIFEGGPHSITNPAGLAKSGITISAAMNISGDNEFHNVIWNNGTLGGTGKTTIPLGKSMTMSAGTLARSIDNYGTVSAAGLNGAAGGAINNLPGGVINVQGDLNGVVFGPAQLNNSGVINVSGSERWIVWRLNNQGTLNALGGIVHVSSPTIQFSNGALLGGTWNVSNGATLDVFTGNIGTLGADAAVTLDGPTSTFQRLNTIQTNQGRLKITNGRKFTTAAALTNTGTFSIGPASTLKVTQSLTNTGVIDLVHFESSLIIDYTSLAPNESIAAQLLTGYNSGLWNGPGINSSFAALDPAMRIGYADNQALGLSNFGGLNVDPTSLLLKVTLGGDANFDEVVDLRDLSLLATHWQASSDWMGGDFDYNGVVNAVDLGILARNWTDRLADVVQSVAAVGLPETAVPEPGSIACFAVALMAFRRRRRVSTSSLPQ